MIIAPWAVICDAEERVGELVRPLYQSAQYVLTHDFTTQLVLIQRTAVPFISIEEVRKAHSLMEAAVAKLDRKKHRLIWDLRQGPLRNDPVFETVTAAYRRSIMSGFARKLVLVATAIGKVQVQRHAAADKLEVEVFDSPLDVTAALGVTHKLKL